MPSQNTKEEVRPEKYYPLWGTKAFSVKVAKYFGTVVFTNMMLKNHKAGSSTSYNTFTVTGSRLNLRIEDEKELLLSSILEKSLLFSETETKKT